MKNFCSWLMDVSSFDVCVVAAPFRRGEMAGLPATVNRIMRPRRRAAPGHWLIFIIAYPMPRFMKKERKFVNGKSGRGRDAIRFRSPGKKTGRRRAPEFRLHEIIYRHTGKNCVLHVRTPYVMAASMEGKTLKGIWTMRCRSWG